MRKRSEIDTRASMYNIYFKTDPEQYLVYNTLWGSIIKIDEEAKECLNNNTFEGLSDEILSMLTQNGFVVDTDETSVFQVFMNRLKYQNNTICFILIPTHRCNMACTYCYQGAGDILVNSMNEENLEKTLKFIKRMATGCLGISISLYGGEPFLESKKILTMLEDLQCYCQGENKSLRVGGTTNGTLLDEDLIIKLKEYLIEDLQITFAGPKRFHDKKRIYKNGVGTYDRLIEVLKLLKKHGVRYHVRVDVDEENYPYIGELLDDLIDKLGKPPRLSIQRISCDLFLNKEQMVRISEISDEHLHELYALADAKGYKTNPIYIGNYRVGCGAIFDNTYVIDPVGDVYKCEAAVGNLDHRLGTISEDGSLININQKAYYKWVLRNPLQFEECRNCEFAPICFAGCALRAYAQFGDIDRPVCYKDQYRANIETYLRDYYPEKWR